jgi:hypothetical protein
MRKSLLFAAAVLGLIAVWFWIGAQFSYWWAKQVNPNFLAKAGQVGDMFGAVGALFSGAAILGLVYTIYLQ